jgi:tripartite-type tricarboxylate transporter receptor subunit TctC
LKLSSYQTRRKLLCVIALAAGHTATFSQTQASSNTATKASINIWPTKTIRIILPFPPGGTSDVFARLLAEKLKTAFNQPVVVESKPGASGIIASELVAKSAADGHTFLFASGAHAINASLYPKLPYDSVKDFTPIAMVVPPGPMVIAVNSALPVKNIKELVDYAKNNPNKLSYASGGVGNSLHLGGEMLAQAANIKMIHVPYKGANPALTDLVAGQVSLMFNSGPAVAPFVKDGKLRIIAQTGTKRLPNLADVATAQEQGLTDFEMTGWFGLFSAAKTPSEIVTRMNQEVQKALQSPEMREKLTQIGSMDSPATTPEAFANFVAIEANRYSKVIKAAGISLEISN